MISKEVYLIWFNISTGAGFTNVHEYDLLFIPSITIKHL